MPSDIFYQNDFSNLLVWIAKSVERVHYIRVMACFVSSFPPNPGGFT